MALDTEITGLDPNEGHRIVEAEPVDGVPVRKTTKYFIDPERTIPKWNTITPWGLLLILALVVGLLAVAMADEARADHNQYVDGKEYGHWTITTPDGTVEKVRYVYGEQVGG